MAMNRARLAGVLVGGSLLVGCTSEIEFDSVALGDREQLAAAYETGIQPSWSSGLKGCFVRDTGEPGLPSESSFAEREALWIEWFEEWERYSGLSITWLPTCPPPVVSASGQLDYRGADQKTVFRVFVDAGANDNPWHVPGCNNVVAGTNFGASPHSEVNPGVDVPGHGDYREPWKSCQANAKIRFGSQKNKVLHELGHKLGFAHENDRVDADGPSCTPGSVGGIFITKYDDDSVMGYEGSSQPPCGDADGDDGLSQLDRLAVEVLYPRSFTPRVHSNFCFQTGGGFVCREGVALVMTPEWRLRGAVSSVFGGAMWYRDAWLVGAGTVFVDNKQEAHLLYLGFSDPFGRDHSTSFQVRRDDSLYAAILAAAVL